MPRSVYEVARSAAADSACHGTGSRSSSSSSSSSSSRGEAAACTALAPAASLGDQDFPDELVAIICGRLCAKDLGRLACVARRFTQRTLVKQGAGRAKLSPIEEGARQAVLRWPQHGCMGQGIRKPHEPYVRVLWRLEQCGGSAKSVVAFMKLHLGDATVQAMGCERLRSLRPKTDAYNSSKLPDNEIRAIEAALRQHPHDHSVQTQGKVARAVLWSCNGRCARCGGGHPRAFDGQGAIGRSTYPVLLHCYMCYSHFIHVRLSAFHSFLLSPKLYSNSHQVRTWIRGVDVLTVSSSSRIRLQRACHQERWVANDDKR